MKTEDEIFSDYLYEKFRETDIAINAPLRDTIEFRLYYMHIRLKELLYELIKPFKR